MFSTIFNALTITGGVIGGISFVKYGQLNIDGHYEGCLNRFVFGASIGALYATTFPISVPLTYLFGRNMYKQGKLEINGLTINGKSIETTTDEPKTDEHTD